MSVLPPSVGRAGLVVAALGVILAVRWLDRHHDWGRRGRERLVLGVPWGTLLVSGFVLAVYLLVQGGLENWYRPSMASRLAMVER